MTDTDRLGDPDYRAGLEEKIYSEAEALQRDAALRRQAPLHVTGMALTGLIPAVILTVVMIGGEEWVRMGIVGVLTAAFAGIASRIRYRAAFRNLD
ncbi:MAG: hypothetical protein RID91_10875 [Azospirillaceae bacterium]